MGILGPGSDGQLVAVVSDVDEAGLLEVALELGTRLRVTTHLVRRLEEGVDPDERLMVRCQGPVLGVVLQVKVLELSPATGREGAEDVLRELGPVKNADTHVSHEDEVKRALVQPRALDIIDLELDVGWEPSRLDRAQVVAEDLGIRVHVAKLNGPDARAGTDVEDSKGLLGIDGSEVDDVANGLGDENVRQVQSLDLLLIVGHNVAAASEGMVTASMLDGEVEDT